MISPWIARLHPAAAPPRRLLCLPHAGGGGATFRGWANDLPDDIDLCVVRLPGRESRLREPLVRRMDQLVGELAAALDSLFDVPCALFGYCSGALTAFELARLLARNGRPPAHLFVCACPSPASVDRDSGIHSMSRPELADHLRALGIIPPIIIDDPNLFALFEPSVRADYEVFETDRYRPGEPLDLPITVFGADGDVSTTVPTLLGWRDETSREFTLRLFPGDHSFFEQERPALVRAVAHEFTATAGVSRNRE